MHYSDTHSKKIKKFLLIGLILGPVLGFPLGYALGYDLGYALLGGVICSVLAIGSIGGAPSAKGYIKNLWEWCLDNGCLGAIIFVFPFGHVTTPLALLIIILILAPIKSIRILLESNRKREEFESDMRKKEEIAKNATLLEQRRGYAAEFHKKSEETTKQCGGRHESHKDICEKARLRSDYKAVALQKKLWDALDNISIPQQKLEDFVTELSTIKESK
jgi:hypothetical protein